MGKPMVRCKNCESKHSNFYCSTCWQLVQTQLHMALCLLEDNLPRCYDCDTYATRYTLDTSLPKKDPGEDDIVSYYCDTHGIKGQDFAGASNVRALQMAGKLRDK